MDVSGLSVSQKSWVSMLEFRFGVIEVRCPADLRLVFFLDEPTFEEIWKLAWGCFVCVERSDQEIG